MKTKLDKYFRISQRGSTIGTELIGGATTFATMAYILAYMTGAMSAVPGIDLTGVLLCTRSEERRVGKECRSRWSPYH